MEGQNDDAAVEAEAQKFIKTDNEDAALNVESFMDAIAGAQDIIAERTSQNPQNRSDQQSTCVPDPLFFRRRGKGLWSD